jgi:heterodisulfide reductase subunit B2
MKIGYYPGCSLEGTSAEYDRSVHNVAQLLELELVELPDWNCCGASSAHMIDKRLAWELPWRNLQIAQQLQLDVLVPCAACFNSLKTARHHVLQGDLPLAPEEEKLTIDVFQITDFLNNEEIFSRIIEKAGDKLDGLPLAAYYGCLTKRPPKVIEAEDYEDPQGLDRIIRVLGGEPLEWTHKNECCSGSLAMTRPDITRTLTQEIVEAALRAGAKAIVADCPMCQANLDTRQFDLQRAGKLDAPLPVIFITELIEIAANGFSNFDRAQKHFIDPTPPLAGIGSEQRRD